jgi:hypothetical protein
MINATGLQPDGSPYVDIPLSDGVLSPGEKVKNVELIFSNPKRVKITFNHSVLGVTFTLIVGQRRPVNNNQRQGKRLQQKNGA